ncbi:MAG: alginate export family protein [Candidatus Omnitrophota bacterium]
MSKRLIIVLAAIIAVGITSIAFAEVQNVKVSGDLLLRGIMRGDWQLFNNTTAAGSVDNWASDKQSYFLRQVRVRVDADLTDNVSTTVRLLNEGVWGNTDINEMADNDDEVYLDLAYATLKEFLYSPLTLTLGRQELQFGNGLIIGDPDTNGLATGWGGTAGVVMTSGASTFYHPATDLTSRKAFDAIRATLDYDPMVVDLFFTKTAEGEVSQDDDTDFFGGNVSYPFSDATMGEAYYIVKHQGRKLLTGNKVNRVDTIGARVKTDLADNLTAQVEAAFQMGKYEPASNPNDGTTKVQKRRAWAAEAIVDYKMKNEKYAKYNPQITGVYAFLSGERRTAAVSTTPQGEYYHGWDSMAENQTLGHIVNGIMGFTNAHILGGSFKMTPAEDVLMGIDYTALWFNKRYENLDSVMLNGLSDGAAYLMNDHRFIGQEVDLTLIYNYTEDVQFGLLAGMFMPGKAFYSGGSTGSKVTNTATELIGSMKVTF